MNVVVITGASHGIGAGLLTAYRERGWAVVANARRFEASTDEFVVHVEGDVAEPATADRVVERALDRFGRIDTLVNNAGLFISKPFTTYTDTDFATITGVNLAGFFWMTQRVIGEMVKRQTGHIVNITTTLVENASTAVPAALTALTKGGISAVTRSLATEYASAGIRVNAVSPGIVETGTTDSYAGLAELHPLGRLGQVSDVVAGVLYLESAGFVTGEILHVDGGQSAGH